MKSLISFPSLRFSRTRLLFLLFVIGYLLLVICYWLLVAPSALAQSGGYTNPITATSIQDIVKLVIKFAQTLITPLSVIAVMIAGFMYVTSGGSEDKIKTANKAITYGLLGLGIVFASDLIVNALTGIGGAAEGKAVDSFILSIADLMGWTIMALSVIFFFYSAFLFMTGSEEEQKLSDAKRTLVYALVGVGVAIVAFSAPGLIKSVVGS